MSHGSFEKAKDGNEREMKKESLYIPRQIATLGQEARCTEKTENIGTSYRRITLTKEDILSSFQERIFFFLSFPVFLSHPLPLCSQIAFCIVQVLIG